MSTPQDYYEEYEGEDEEEVSTGYKILAGLGGVLATLLIVGIMAAVTFFVLPSFNKPQRVVVPSVLGQTVDKATAILEDKNLAILLAGEEASDTYTPGTIMRQTPNGEKVVEPGTVINVVVAKQKEVIEEVVVPNLKGEESANAQSILSEMDLDVALEWEYSDELDRSKVISHTPEAGVRVKKGDTVTLVLSKGKEVVLVKVPNLYNLTLDEAKAKLNEVGLRFGQTVEENSDTVEQGKVMKQSIAENQEIEQGEIVDIVISKGPKVEEVIPPEEDPNNPTTPDTDIPSEENTPEEGPLATITRVINAPTDKLQDEYHVLVLIEDDLGARTAFDGIVKKEQFPLPIQVSGKGKGVLTTFFDGQEEYRDNNINFDEVTQ